MIDAENLDEATLAVSAKQHAIAGRVPAARKGTVKIRPIVELPGLPSEKEWR